MTIYTQPRIRQGGYLEEYTAPLSDYLGATVDEAFNFNPTPSLVRSGRLRAAEEGQLNFPTRAALTALGTVYPPAAAYNVAEAPGLPGFFRDEPDSPVVDAAAARARIKEEGLDLTVPDTGIRSRALDILIERKKEERRRNDVLNRGPSGVIAGTLRLGTMLGTSALDPLNIASAFVPVVSQARYTSMLAQAGSRLGRAGVRARIGAVEGAAGAALVEPLIYGAANQEQADYGLADSLLNIGLGTALGGGLHVGAGVVGDWRTARAPRDAPLPRLLESVDAGTREQALRTSVAQAAEGRLVDVEPIISYAPQRVEGELRASVGPEAFIPTPAMHNEIAGLLDRYGIAYRVENSKSNTERYGPSFSTYYILDDGTKIRLSDHNGPIPAEYEVGLREGTVTPARAVESILTKRGRPTSIEDRFAEQSERANAQRATEADLNTRTELMQKEFARRVSAIQRETGKKMKPREKQGLREELAAKYGLEGKAPGGSSGNGVSPFGDSDLASTQPPLGAQSGALPTGLIKESISGAELQARVSASFAPENIRLYDGEAVRIADERIATAPKDEDMPETSLAEIMEDVQRITLTLDDPELVTREMADFDALAKTADEYGNAVRAAADCRLARGA